MQALLDGEGLSASEHQMRVSWRAKSLHAIAVGTFGEMFLSAWTRVASAVAQEIRWGVESRGMGEGVIRAPLRVYSETEW